MSPDNSGDIPGFALLGTQRPQVLSDKVILTPPAPGHQRGAVWSKNAVSQRSWTTDVDFRVTGPERGGGNLNVWLANDGVQRVATSGIYTANKWDGLAIVIDQHGGSAGMVRGFLNDGTVDYSSHPAVDTLAFGHCTFPYRNRGTPSQLKIRHSDEKGLRVDIDGRLCFETNKIRIAPGYNFGITSASAETPDSHEIFKMVVMTEDLDSGVKNQQQQDTEPQKPIAGGEKARSGRSGMFQGRDDSDDYFDDDIPDSDPDTILSSKAQFADLHNRITSINHHINTISRMVSKQGTIGERRHDEMVSQIQDMKQILSRLEAVEEMKNNLVAIEKQVNLIKRDFSQQIRNNERAMKGYVEDAHNTLHEKVIKATPGHRNLIAIIVGSQIVMAGLYILYKRRQNAPHKKFL